MAGDGSQGNMDVPRPAPSKPESAPVSRRGFIKTLAGALGFGAAMAMTKPAEAFPEPPGGPPSAGGDETSEAKPAGPMPPQEAGTIKPTPTVEPVIEATGSDTQIVQDMPKQGNN